MSTLWQGPVRAHFTKPTIFIEKTEVGENRLLPITIRERFSQIPDSDLKLLGYDPSTARPEWFILQALPVPPVTVRPSIILETGIRSVILHTKWWR